MTRCRRRLEQAVATARRALKNAIARRKMDDLTRQQLFADLGRNGMSSG